MFNLNDHVWLVTCQWEPKRITCPDCCGKRFLRVILGDDSVVSVDCPECRLGYEGSQGTISTYDYIPRVQFLQITGIESNPEGIRYHLDGHYGSKECDVFAMKSTAEARSGELAVQCAAEEAKRIASKEKEHKAWAWNATYHRRCIRKAEKEIVYHKSKLEVALAHKKEEKAATQTV